MRQLVLVNGGGHTFLTVLFKISTYSRDYVISDVATVFCGNTQQATDAAHRSLVNLEYSIKASV